MNRWHTAVLAAAGFTAGMASTLTVLLIHVWGWDAP